MESPIELAYDAYLTRKFTSIRSCARHFGVPYTTLQNRIKAKVKSLPKRRSRHAKLTDAQDEVLLRYIRRLVSWSHSPRLETIRNFANTLLAQGLRDGATAPLVGNHWPARWLERHPEFSIALSKPMESVRLVRYSRCELERFYNNFEALVRDYGIPSEDMYNMDETGVRMGVAKRVKVIYSTGTLPLVTDQRNRESCTVIECVCADGTVLDPMVITKGKRLSTNLAIHMPDGYTAAVSQKGWTNNKLGLSWLKSFDEQTKSQTKGKWRLLITDGHSSHITPEWVDYCEEHSIISFCLPPHTTHILQPLDVGLFQPFKHYHGREVEAAARNLDTEYARSEFLAKLSWIRKQTFTKSNIKSAWRRSGLVPFNPSIVLDTVKNTDLTSIEVEQENPPESLSSPEQSSTDPPPTVTPRTVRAFDAGLTDFRTRLIYDMKTIGSPSTYVEQLESKLRKSVGISMATAESTTEELGRLKHAADERVKRKESRRFTAGLEGGEIRVEWARDIHNKKLHVERIYCERKEARRKRLAEKQASYKSAERIIDSDAMAADTEDEGQQGEGEMELDDEAFNHPSDIE